MVRLNYLGLNFSCQVEALKHLAILTAKGGTRGISPITC